MKTKVCSTCKKEFPLTIEFFTPAKTHKDGFLGQCRPCVAIYKKEHFKRYKVQAALNMKKYRKTHMESCHEYSKKYHLEHVEEGKQYHLNNREHHLEMNKKRYYANVEHCNEVSRLWRTKHKEYVANYNHAWGINNRDKCNMLSEKRRTMKELLPASFTKQQWDDTKLFFNNKCAYCGKELPLSQDHFIALSKGGEYTINNIVPVCHSCNSRKNNLDFFKWFPKQSFYSKKREQKILKYLNYKDDVHQLRIL